VLLHGAFGSRHPGCAIASSAPRASTPNEINRLRKRVANSYRHAFKRVGRWRGIHDSFSPGAKNQRQLWDEFKRIQTHVGIHLDCPEDHDHTPSCFLYGFHDLRRAFATVNAPQMKPEFLQKLMRHKSCTTTLGYINLVSQVDEAVANMPVPKVLRKDDKDEKKGVDPT
jgi:integrase